MDNRQVVVDDTSPKQTVYIYACKGSTVQVGRALAQSRQQYPVVTTQHHPRQWESPNQVSLC